MLRQFFALHVQFDAFFDLEVRRGKGEGVLEEKRVVGIEFEKIFRVQFERGKHFGDVFSRGILFLVFPKRNGGLGNPELFGKFPLGELKMPANGGDVLPDVQGLKSLSLG